MTTAQIKIGDVLKRENDHLGRHDDAVTVTGIVKGTPRLFQLAGYWRQDAYATQLSAEHYTNVYRDGQKIGTFFVKYW